MYKQGLFLALQVASHLAYMILVPLILFGGAGLYIDRRYHTLPEFLLIGIAVAFVATVYWLRLRLLEVVNLKKDK